VWVSQEQQRGEVQDLVLRARAGDHVAYSTLVDRYKDSLFRLAFKILRRDADAEDAVQEAFIKAYVHLDSYDSHYSFYTWLSTILSNVCFSAMRARDWKLIPVSDQLLHGLRSADPALHPEASALVQSRDDLLRHAIVALPEKYARILILRYWSDLSYQEVATATDQSLGAVKTQIRRATSMLREALDGFQADLAPEPA
jgi:RNA polymerase sigma-70 factor (ECF subfamily)